MYIVPAVTVPILLVVDTLRQTFRRYMQVRIIYVN